MRARRSIAERFFGWWISKCGARRARPSGETFSGMRIFGRGGVEGEEEGEEGIAEGAISGRRGNSEIECLHKIDTVQLNSIRVL